MEPNTAARRLLVERRSVPAKTMTDPGPSPDQLQTILQIGARVPDHRMVEPFRFVVLRGAGKTAFSEMLRTASTAPEGKASKAADLYEQAPLGIVVISSPDTDHKTPVWEQELTVGAACQNLLAASHAEGFGAQWLTGWPAYDPTVAAALELGEAERVAGIIFIGTPTVQPEERKRPDLSQIVRHFER